MGWYWKSPQAFPAMFTAVLKNACAEPDEAKYLGSFGSRADAKAVAERFRWFKWCVTSRPDRTPDLAGLLSNFEVRSQIKEDEVGFILTIRARHFKLDEFFALNPELARSIASEI